MGGFYMQYLEGLCRRRGWHNPMYETYTSSSGYTCLVLVNGREYQTDLTYESDILAQEKRCYARVYGLQKLSCQWRYAGEKWCGAGSTRFGGEGEA